MILEENPKENSHSFIELTVCSAQNLPVLCVQTGAPRAASLGSLKITRETKSQKTILGSASLCSDVTPIMCQCTSPVEACHCGRRQETRTLGNSKFPMEFSGNLSEWTHQNNTHAPVFLCACGSLCSAMNSSHFPRIC